MDRDAARVRPHRRDRGPGFTPFPRHPILRANDLVGPHVAVAAVRAALADRGIPEADRDEPVGTTVRALLASTGAGTVITLERRGDRGHPRVVVLPRLARLLEDLVVGLENDARGPCNPPENGRTRHDPGRDETVTIGIRSVPGGFASTPEA